MYRNLLFYIAVLSVFGVGTYLVLDYGARVQPRETSMERKLEPGSAGFHQQQPKTEASTASLVGELRQNLQHPLSILLLQVVVVILAARIVGNLFLRMGQPAVIGEIVAGIILGPSLLGMFFPGAQVFLFPASSMDFLKLLSQVGVILFMFIVGMDLNVQHLRQKAHAAVLVSHASIVVPFFLGVTLALLIYPSMAPAHISFSAFALFIGVAMSITAFPVLARIIAERGLNKTHLGSTAIACAAVDDVTAWCILAMVVALVRANGLSGGLLTIFLTLIFIGVMLFVVKPQADRLLGEKIRSEINGKGTMALVLVIIFTSGLFTEVIGIHALFGAFLAGVVMPSHESLRNFLRQRLETVSSGFLLPLFFAYTGLRTQIGLLDDWQSWLVCLGVIGVAIAGKLGGSMLAARWTGMNWQESFSLGALMNTRGLIELIVLNLGYDLGILPPKIFGVMVLMALTTTFMTGPLLSLSEFWSRRRALIGKTANPQHESRVALPGVLDPPAGVKV
ncbi:MAG: cation:proton antiporter [Pyrinomonadaceae bacterium]|nr:cation:proton antiporter [Pyrinomonadaceae bacterium]